MADVYELIAEAARRKNNFVDAGRVPKPLNVGRVPAPRPRPVPSGLTIPAPRSGAGGAGAAGAAGGGATPFSDSLREAAAAAADSGDGGGLLDTVGGAVGGGLMKVLEVADIGRRAYQGLAGEVGDFVAGQDGAARVVGEVLQNTVNPFRLRGLADENGERDKNFDLGEIRRRVTGTDQISEGFLGQTTWDDDLPGWMRPVLGFAGDLATDPVTYATFGVGGVVKEAGERAAISAARETLAREIAVNAASDAGQKVASEVVDNLIREVGSRGYGGLTRAGLRRAGATTDDLVALGVRPEFGVRFGAGRASFKVPGSAAAGEMAENFKGSIKKVAGRSAPARMVRELFTSAEHGHAVLRRKVLEGAPDAPTAARWLAVVDRAKGDSFQWLGEQAGVWANLSVDVGGKTRRLRDLTDEESRALFYALDTGRFEDSPFAETLSNFFRKAGDSMESAGVEFGRRSNYVPYRLTEKARALWNTGDENIRAVVGDSLDETEAFQRARTSGLSAQDINEAWRRNHDFDLIETDVRVAGAQYLAEGQRAVMRAKLAGADAERLGLVKPLTDTLDETAVRKDLDAAASNELKLLNRSVSARRQAAGRALRVAQRSVNDVAKQLDDFTGKINRQAEKITRLTAREAELLTESEAADQALLLAERAARQARGRQKTELTNKIKKLQAAKDAQSAELKSVRNRLRTAQTGQQSLQIKHNLAKVQYDNYEKLLKQTQVERDMLNTAPLKVDEAATVRAQQATERFVTAQSDTAAAETTLQWLRSDAGRVSDRLGAEMARLDELGARLERTRLSKSKADMDELLGARDVLRDMMDDLRGLLRDAPSKDAETFLKLEAQAVAADAAFWRSTAGSASGGSRRLRAQFDAGVDLLTNPNFQKYVSAQVDQGNVLLQRAAGDVQVDGMYAEATAKFRRMMDPEGRGEAFQKLHKGMRQYGKAMNWWKGWALASPGFVARNLYSGMFNMWLDDALNPALGSRFSRYLRLMRSNPEEAAQWALKKFGQRDADRLQEAYRVAAASGWGQTSEEVASDMAGKRVKWLNIASSESAYPRAIRWASSESEAFMRGGHALAVLHRGGSFDDALARVQKFHFNYRDISEADRFVKNVAMPFWTFWSRNLALQLSVFAKRPSKINRSFVNFKRNVQESSDPDEGLAVPEYLTGEMAGVLTPFGSASGRGRLYVTPDLPSARFPAQMDNLFSGDFLTELGSNLGPTLKVPLELATNRQMFGNRPFRNSLTSWSSEGEVPREAPVWGQVPGVSQALGLLPGAERVGDRLLMQDNVESAITNFNPVLGRAARLFPSSERSEETFRQYWLNFLGSPVRWNDPGSQSGELARRRREAEEAAAKVQERIRLERLVSER